MYTLLRTGVEVLKHSRKGGPAFKKLYCDVNMTKLYWRERGTSRPDAAMDNCPEDASYYPTLADPSASCAALARGVDITVPATSKSGSAPRRTYGAKSNAERVMYIRDITEVSWGRLPDCRCAFYVRCCFSWVIF